MEMKVTGHTILITGGGSGIGRGLAEAFHRRGNRVIVAGRRQEALDEVAQANPGIASAILDIQNADGMRAFAAQIIRDHPTLDVLINNAGVMRLENLREGNVAGAEAMVATNLLGPIRLTAALLPHLLGRPSATIMNVSSGLAFVPMAATATYCATKAAIHSYTQSLRHQLKGSNIEVLELIPPYVQTELMSNSATDPRAMPLPEFISEVMEILETQPDAPEICVSRVKALRFAEAKGSYDAIFHGINGEPFH